MSLSNNFRRLSGILAHIKKFPSKEGALAKKAYHRSIAITLLIILAMIPLNFFLLPSISNDALDYPIGATTEVYGHISRYEDTFWYTDSSQKYEFSFDDYGIDDSYEHGGRIIIYLDENDEIVGVSHEKEDNATGVNIILMLAVPIALLLLHSFVGRKTYCKWWTLYGVWFEKEIEPYIYQNDFEKIVADKRFYDARVRVKDLSVENQKKYKEYLFKGILYSALLLICIALTICLCIQFDLRSDNLFVVAAIVIYVLIFYVLIDNCDTEMHRIKSGYYEKTENNALKKQ